MFQCTACGLLSVRDTSCPACGGTSFLDLEAEDTASLEGFGEVPGLDEAATALHEIAPPPEQEPVEKEEPEGDLPFGFGGMARAHAPSLPFGFGASSLGLAVLQGEPSVTEASPQPSNEHPAAIEDASPEPSGAVAQATVEAPLPQVPTEDESTHSVMLEPAPEVSSSLASEGTMLAAPELWSNTTVNVRDAYGLAPAFTEEVAVESKVATVKPEVAPPKPAWPPFAVIAPESALLDGLLREPTVEAFRALANEEWSLAQERFELVLATGVDGVSLRTAAGIACMELGDDPTAGLQHLKQAAKLSGGNLTTLHNLAVAMAMDGRTEGLERLLASVANVPDEGGLVSRMHEAQKLMESASV